jgi:hypothetical protein
MVDNSYIRHFGYYFNSVKKQYFEHDDNYCRMISVTRQYTNILQNVSGIH